MPLAEKRVGKSVHTTHRRQRGLQLTMARLSHVNMTSFLNLRRSCGEEKFLRLRSRANACGGSKSSIPRSMRLSR